MHTDINTLMGCTVIFQPFVDPDQPIHQYFLPRVYAIAVPLVAGVISLGLIGMFYCIFLKSMVQK